MLYIIFMIPLLMILIGYLMFKYPPKKINYIIGYRTSKSMKNKKTWDIANKYCGKLWIKVGIIMLIITSILFFIFELKILAFTEIILSIIVLLQVGIMLLSVFIVEKKLKQVI